MDKALSGIRVIDMTHNQAGPACAQILGFLGADVIKLEEAKGGDIARRNMRDRDGDSLFFLLFNANKRSLTLNLKTGRGKELFQQLIAKSDVLVENFSPGALDRLGLGWDVLAKINPRLVYATIKGFGSYGPYANYKSFEPVAQAMGGAMSVTGYPENPPTFVVPSRSEEHTSELQSLRHLVCRLLLDPALTEIYPLSLHDALPISRPRLGRPRQDQPAPGLCDDQGLWQLRPLRQLQELRAGGAGDGRGDERHRLPGKSADFCRAVEIGRAHV